MFTCRGVHVRSLSFHQQPSLNSVLHLLAKRDPNNGRGSFPKPRSRACAWGCLYFLPGGVQQRRKPHIADEVRLFLGKKVGTIIILLWLAAGLCVTLDNYARLRKRIAKTFLSPVKPLIGSLFLLTLALLSMCKDVQTSFYAA